MGLFDVFKKKKPQKEEMRYVSYSHVTKDGQFMESFGYHCENTAKAFFDSLSQKELDKLKRRSEEHRQKTKEVLDFCKYCHKEIYKIERVHRDGRSICQDCAEQVEMLNKLRQENAKIVDKHYKVAGYGRGEERELIVLFNSENYGYFCIKQLRCPACAGCAYQLVPKDTVSPTAEMFASDTGYSIWFGEWFSEYLGSLM